MDVFRQRLEDEHDANVIITAPTVPYKGMILSLNAMWQDLNLIFLVIYRDREAFVSNPTDFPDVGDIGIRVKEIQEPVVKASIIVPEGVYSCRNTRVAKKLKEKKTRILWGHDGALLLASC